MRNRRGQTVVEYVLVIVLISLAIVFAFREANIDKAVQEAAGNIQEKMVDE